MNTTVRDIMSTHVIRHLEGVIAVRDRLTYPRETRSPSALI
jgi:hypothetical protein